MAHSVIWKKKKINKSCTRQLDVTAHGVAAHSSNRCLNLPRYDVNLASNNNDHPNKLPRLGRQRVAWGDALSMTYEAPAWLTCEKKKKKIPNEWSALNLVSWLRGAGARSTQNVTALFRVLLRAAVSEGARRVRKDDPFLRATIREEEARCSRRCATYGA